MATTVKVGDRDVTLATPKKKKKQGKRGRKIGRWSKKPSNQRYLAQRRWEKNKARRAARRAREAKAKA